MSDTTIKEGCSCGATFEVRAYYSYARDDAATWRTNHLHEMPPAPAQTITLDQLRDSIIPASVARRDCEHPWRNLSVQRNTDGPLVIKCRACNVEVYAGTPA
jgi:hypothetical protein